MSPGTEVVTIAELTERADSTLRDDREAAQSQLDAMERLRAVLKCRPFGFFTDVDGTISPLAATPQAAVISPHTRALLRSLAALAHVIIISGRTLVDVRRLVGLRGVTYVGSHGLATWIDGREELDGSVRPYVRLAQQAMNELSPLRRIGGVLFEEKGTGIAIHYRMAQNGEEARASILRGIAAAGSAAHFDLFEGVRVIELRPRLGLNKGTSVRSLVNRFRLEGLIYAGDDVTDVEAFEAVRDLRSGGRIDGMSIAARNSETTPEVEAAADFSVDSVTGVESLLSYCIRALGGTVASTDDLPGQ